MRQRQHWTKEQKAEFWAAFVRHRDEGCNIREAYQRACADFQSVGKTAPGWFTFQNWYQKAIHAVRGPMDDTAESADPSDESDGSNAAEATNRPSSPSGPAIAEEPEADDAQEEAEVADPPSPRLRKAIWRSSDYTRRLELMCRLYRSRSEYNIDAVCDYLLPDLCAEEE